MCHPALSHTAAPVPLSCRSGRYPSIVGWWDASVYWVINGLKQKLDPDTDMSGIFQLYQKQMVTHDMCSFSVMSRSTCPPSGGSLWSRFTVTSVLFHCILSEINKQVPVPRTVHQPRLYQPTQGIYQAMTLRACTFPWPWMVHCYMSSHTYHVWVHFLGPGIWQPLCQHSHPLQNRSEKRKIVRPFLGISHAFLGPRFSDIWKGGMMIEASSLPNRTSKQNVAKSVL